MKPGITPTVFTVKLNGAEAGLRIVDTGGILPEDKDFIPAEIFSAARLRSKRANAVVHGWYGRTEMQLQISTLASSLIRTGKPLFLSGNKVDTEKQQGLTDDVYRLGIRRLFPISAENARGLDDLLDAVLEILPPANQMTTGERGDTEEEEPEAPEPHETKVAIIGIPTLANPPYSICFTGADRSIVSPIPGTTRDAVDEIVRA